MDFLIKWIASLFETFKTKNPLAAAVILAASATVLNGATNGQFYGLFTLPDWATEAIKWVSTFILAVTGSQTYRYLPEEKQATARPS